ncbi:laccase-1-like [Nylanderia fulva]|uniref:laccase-1-like n=1 Tax=Nylanderia fulva TaxID=613905 RepID=UPI0010FB7312|nr:laccase-1-like [Nylanderia fulva]
MCFLHRSIFFCVILIYCVVGIQSQIKDNAISVKDTIPIKNSATRILTDTLSKRVIGGVDDDRENIKTTCWVEVNSTSSLPNNLSSPLECARTCNNKEKPKTCYYRFEAEVYSSLSRACDYCKPNTTNVFCNNCQCVPVDGIGRTILTINRMIPGPSIDVCEGDKIVVDVVNNMEGEGLTIHWHGLFQKGSQYYDGPLVTQCPIPAHSTFRYQFNANNVGTHFWHSHVGLQKMDGIFGSLTVRQSAKRDVNSYLYDFDLSRHNFIISDWMHELASSRLPGSLYDTKFQNPDSFLINGKGRYEDPESGIINTEIFRVKRNYRYRFRMVNAFCTTCASLLTVEGHNLTIIAADGVPVKPIVVDSIISASAERYDFVINTNNRVDSYWIQLRAVGSCERTSIQQLAILQYDGASDVPTTPPPTFNASLPAGIVLNPLDDKCDPSRTDAICMSNMESAIPVDKGILKKKPDAQFYLSFKFHQYDLQDLFAPNHFYKFIVGPGFTHTAAVINDIMFQFPSSPPLSQLRDIPPDRICNETHKPDSCGDDICSCTHIIKLPYNGIIELVIVDETKIPNLHHPFHLHGYAFNIMSAGAPNNGTGTTAKEIKILDKKGLLSRRKILPPFKDTIAVPNNGYVIIRFRANNPGYWLLHCHFVYHLTLGMANIFHVDGPDLPPIPKDFPKCGNFVPSISH